MITDPPEASPKLTSDSAKTLSALGASKGGKARAKTMTPEERSEVARNAVRARWAKAGKLKPTPPAPQEVQPPKALIPAGEVPFSMFRGTLQIGDMEMECHVLSDGRRVFTQGEVVRVLTRGVDSSNLKRYLNANPLIDNVESVGQIIPFKIPSNPTLANGSEATTLIEICEKYLQASEQDKLKSNQTKLAIQAGVIIRSCAKVGIIALIDEATGFQKFRQKRDLQIKFQAFIADELQEWGRMFPPTFWHELARLEGIQYSPRNRPLRWGKYIMAFVYDTIDGDVGKELRKKNRDPHFLSNHHQWLKKFGQDKVRSQIDKVTTIMQLCVNMTDFRQKFAKVFSKTPLQASFDDINWNVS